MKSDNKYRFSLSWGMDTEDQLLAGAFLESMGNRKSRFIVGLVCDYLNGHPEISDSNAVKLVLASPSAGKMLEEKIREMVQQEMAGHTVIRDGAVQSEAKTPAADDVADMAKNLEVWDI